MNTLPIPYALKSRDDAWNRQNCRLTQENSDAITSRDH